MAFLSGGMVIVYFILKMMFWDYFEAGIIPILLCILFFASVQLGFLGILGEYIGFIHTQVFQRPYVVEKERINFDKETIQNETNN